MISDTLAHVLRSGRNDFNARVADARRRFSSFDTRAFSSFLETAVDPVAAAVAAVRPDAVPQTVSSAYDIAIELVGRHLVGPAGCGPLIDEAWTRLLPAAAPAVAAAPARMLSAVSNALYRLCSTPGARPRQWLDDMLLRTADAAGPDLFLAAGQVAGWRAGLAHFRDSALAIAAQMPASLALAILEVPPDVSWEAVRRGLSADPWYDPARAADQPSPGRLRPVGRVGAFRGFGGSFREPPRVATVEGRFVVTSGGEEWVMTTDVFGATFHRTTPTGTGGAAQPAPPVSGVSVEDSTVFRGSERLRVEGAGVVTSVAVLPHTLALTFSHTHRIALVALT